MNTQPPSIGKIVGYRPIKQAVDKTARPAMIVEVKTDGFAKDRDRVTLEVHSPSGNTVLDADWSEQGAPGSWFWLPEVALREKKSDASATETTPTVPAV